MSDDEMQELIRHGWIPPPRALSERKLLREAREALAGIEHMTRHSPAISHQRVIHDLARAAADKIRAALTQETQT